MWLIILFLLLAIAVAWAMVDKSKASDDEVRMWSRYYKDKEV